MDCSCEQVTDMFGMEWPKCVYFGIDCPDGRNIVKPVRHEPSPEWDAATDRLRSVFPHAPSVDARLLCSTSPQTARAINMTRYQMEREGRRPAVARRLTGDVRESEQPRESRDEARDKAQDSGDS